MVFVFNIFQCWTHLKSDACNYNARNSKLLRNPGNDTDQFLEYHTKFKRILNIMGRSHMNGMELIPEVCATSSIFNLLTPILSNKRTVETRAALSTDSVTLQEHKPIMKSLQETTNNLAENIETADKTQEFKVKVLSLLMDIADNIHMLYA